MNKPVVDWKFAVALSAPVAVGILLWKLDKDQAFAVSQNAINAIKEYVLVLRNKH